MAMAIFKSGLPMIALMAVGVGYAISDGKALQGEAQAPALPPNSFRIVLQGSDTGCDVTLGGPAAQAKARLVFSNQCTDRLPSLAKAQFWRESSDGALAFVDDEGRVRMLFGVGDGVAYESFGAGAPLVSLVSLND